MTEQADWPARVHQGLADVHARIRAACARAGRDPASVRLLAVSKTHPPEAIRAAYAEGQRELGENYVQEMLAKAHTLTDLPDLRWRFIGHLQRNKVKDVLAIGATIDTLDSIRLAEAIDRHAQATGQRVEVLLQVNVGGEVQKSGCAPDDLGPLVERARALGGLDLRGLMTVPPDTDDPEGARPFFRRLRELAEQHGLSELSMGMTHDLEVAIEEGATVVRVGTAVFGAREG